MYLSAAVTPATVRGEEQQRHLVAVSGSTGPGK